MNKKVAKICDIIIQPHLPLPQYRSSTIFTSVKSVSFEYSWGEIVCWRVKEDFLTIAKCLIFMKLKPLFSSFMQIILSSLLKCVDASVQRALMELCCDILYPWRVFLTEQKSLIFLVKNMNKNISEIDFNHARLHAFCCHYYYFYYCSLRMSINKSKSREMWINFLSVVTAGTPTDAIAECDVNCASGCSIKGDQKCDSQCTPGFNLTTSFTCSRM